MTLSPNEAMRVLPRHPWAGNVAGALRQAAAGHTLVVWQMPPEIAQAMADLLERGGEAIETVEAHVRAQDEDLDRMRVSFAAAQARKMEADAREQRRAVWVYALMLAGAGHMAFWQVVDLVLRVLGAAGGVDV